MGGSGGGGSTRVSTQQNPPQLLPEGAAGFGQASDYFKNILAQPPIFGGQRVAAPAPGQTAAWGAAPGLTGTSPSMQAAQEQVASTANPNSIFDPRMNAAIFSASQPIFQQFEQQTIPGIRDLFTGAGQGTTSTRAPVATNDAISTLGESLGTSVVAPIFQSERQNQLAAAGLAPSLDRSRVENLLTSAGLGGQQQQQSQAELGAEQAKFEEPIFRQSGAAQQLAGMATAGPGGSSSVSKEIPGAKGTTNSALGAVGAIAPLLLLAFA